MSHLVPSVPSIRTQTVSSSSQSSTPTPGSALVRMSLSPTSPDSDVHNSLSHGHKRARTDSFDFHSASPVNGIDPAATGSGSGRLGTGHSNHANQWAAQGIPPGHIPKRGARACTACRKGKNRCEGESPCRRCQLNGTVCVFEKPDRKGSQVAAQAQAIIAAGTNPALERVSRLEGQILTMQSQFLGMQSSLDRILHALSPSSAPPPAQPPVQQGIPLLQQQQHQPPPGPPPMQVQNFSNASQSSGPFSMQYAPPVPIPSHLTPHPHGVNTMPYPARSSSSNSSNEVAGGDLPFYSDTSANQMQIPQQIPGQGVQMQQDGSGVVDPPRSGRQKKFPPLPGFAPPAHKFATYGIVPSTAPSSDDESEDTLPRAALAAPIEALQGLANAAAEAAALPDGNAMRNGAVSGKKRKRVEPIPRNAFPGVLEKGLVKEDEARELYDIFFSGCHLFIPLFDPSYDTFESLVERTPFCYDSILAVAAKIRAGNSPPGQTFFSCLEEAQGIARSTLFGPVVRKEGVQATMVLAVWSQSAWLPAGHAVRMALDLGLHRALDKLADHAVQTGRQFTESEERDLVISARIWLCLYWYDHQMSLGSDRPIMMPDDSSVRNCRLLLSHRMSTLTDLRLITMVELIVKKQAIHESLLRLDGRMVDHTTLAFVDEANLVLDQWWQESDEMHKPRVDEDHLMRKMLASELWYAKLWLICTILRGVSWEKMTYEQKKLAFQAKQAASNCLSTFLNSESYRTSLQYAVQDILVTAAFSALFLLKLANLFPGEVDLGTIMSQVAELAQLFQEAASDRYALTLRLMLSKLRRKLGFISGSVTTLPSPNSMQQNIPLPGFDPNSISALPAMEDLGLNGFYDDLFNTTTLPAWLQGTDLGFPGNLSDDLFLQLGVGPATWGGGIADMSFPTAW